MPSGYTLMELNWDSIQFDPYCPEKDENVKRGINKKKKMK